MFLMKIKSGDGFYRATISTETHLLGSAFKSPYHKKWIATTVYNPVSEYFDSPVAAIEFVKREYLKRLWLPL